MLRIVLEATNLIQVKDKTLTDDDGQEEGFERTLVLQDPLSGLTFELPLQAKGREIFENIIRAEPGEELQEVLAELFKPEQAPDIIIPDFLPPSMDNGDQG